jgi:hypothetical protein
LGVLTDDPPGVLPAWADYDNDGFLDVVVPSGASDKPNDLYHNDGNGNHWMLVRPVGTRSNRSGIGAKVRAQATIWGQSVQQMQEISGTPFAGDPRAHFGLGDATKVATLRLEWPSGTVEEFTDVAANQILTIVEPSLRGAFGTDGLFHLTLTGNTNRTYQVDASGNLLNWTTLTNCAGPGPNATLDVCDPAAGQARRFYRLN